MAEDDVRIVKPSIDYTKIPEELAGKWVAVNRNTQALLGASDTPEGALEAAAVATGDPALRDLVMARVPEKPGMAESKPERRLIDQLRDFLMDEDLHAEKLEAASETLLPKLHDDYCRLARENEDLRAEIANFDAIRAQDRAVGVLLVELAGHLGMACEVNSESILRRAIEYVRREETGHHA